MVSSIVSKVSEIARVRHLTPQTEESIRHLMALMKPRPFKLTTAIHMDGNSKQVKIDFRDSEWKKWPHIELVGLADVQWGQKAVKIETLASFVDWILDKPYRFVAGIGDWIDAAHALTPGSSFDNLFNAQSQIFTFCELIAPMAHRILGSVGGNHERRGVPFFGDLGHMIAVLLQLPYSDGRQMVRIHYGAHDPFMLLLSHGHARAKTIGALGQIMERRMRLANAHLYLTGHNHQGIMVPKFREIHSEGSIRKELYIGAAGTSFLETYGTYAEWMEFESYETIMPLARIFPKGGWEYVFPSTLTQVE